MNENKTTTVNESNEEEVLNKKVEDFRSELNVLQDKYAFRLEAILHYTPRGVIPGINVMSVEVPKVEVPKAEEPKVE